MTNNISLPIILSAIKQHIEDNNRGIRAFLLCERWKTDDANKTFPCVCMCSDFVLQFLNVNTVNA